MKSGKALDSSMSSVLSTASSTSSRWEETKNLARSLHDRANRSLNTTLDTSRDTRDYSFASETKKAANVSDCLDTASDMLSKYIKKYNCKVNPMLLDDSLSDIYSKLNDGLPKDLDSSISFIPSIKSEGTELSISKASQLTTNSEDLFHQLDRYEKRFGTQPKKPIRIFDLSTDISDKENVPVSNSKPKTTKKTIPKVNNKRPQSLKVSTIKGTQEAEKAKTASSVTRSRNVTKPTISSKAKKVISKPQMQPTQTNRAQKAVEMIATKKMASNSRKINNSTDTENSTEDERECKSCQTSMIKDSPVPSSIDVLSVPSSPMPMVTHGPNNEIAFKIIGSTENIEKVEVYLKNGTSNKPSSTNYEYNDSESRIIDTFFNSYEVQKYEPKCAISDVGVSMCGSEVEIDNTLKPLKSLYSKYFTHPQKNCR